MQQQHCASSRKMHFIVIKMKWQFFVMMKRPHCIDVIFN